MSGAKMWERGASPQAALDALSESMGIRNEIGKAADSRLAQPDRIIWVALENTRQMRECTAAHEYAAEGLEVFYEVSNEYDVTIRGIDVAKCEALERRLVSTMITVGLWSGATSIGNGSLASSDNTAAEQGAAIVWRIRLWTPIVHETLTTGHIDTATVGVKSIDSTGTTTGTVP